MPKRIYISSTFRDLHEYRAQAEETLGFLSDFFHLVTPMEKMMPGSGQPALTACRRLVQSCDIYILIIGKIYGSIADGTGRSFTEYEYLEARNKGKIIIALIADPDAQGLAEIQVDNEKAFNSFRDDVRTNYVTFQKNFSSPHHMSTQLTLALYQFAETKWELTPEIKLRCNRSAQYDTMVINRKRGQLNVFTIVCNQKDRPDLFLQRMAIFEFGFQQEFIEESMDTSVIFGNYQQQYRQRFILHILKPMINVYNEDVPESIADGLHILTLKNVKRVFLYFHLTREDAADTGVMSSIKTILAELKTACAEHQITFFLTFVFKFREGTAPDRGIAGALTMEKGFPLFHLETFKMIDEDDTVNWLRTYITKNSDKIEDIKAYLFGEQEALYMNDIYTKLRDINRFLN